MLKRSVSLIVLAVVVAACGSGEPDRETSGGPEENGSEELVVQAANYDLAAGEKSRFIAGLLTQNQLFVSFGEIDMSFFYLGTEEETGTAETGPTATGRFLAIEGDPEREGPVAGPASVGRGVYAANVTFDRAGFWAVEVRADVENRGVMSGRAVFEVRDDHLYPAVGDRAPKTKSLVLSSDAPRPAIDSRARDGAPVPDEALHRTTIAESIERGEPALVVFSTPVYCVSRFCGPVTDMVAGLQKDYANRANFTHVEVWWNFEKRVLNRAAAEWLLHKQDLTEPWIYLIGGDGKIRALWDNVATREEIEPVLRNLPPLD